MSVLETPRILFRGQIAWDPIVTNNYPNFYDEDDCESVLPPVAVHTAVADFRKSAIASVANGNWNPHGTHRSHFYQTEVSGVDLGAGVSTADPVVGSPVGLMGMLVDCEPFGSVSSQIFFDTMHFGIPGGCRIEGARSSRFIARYINFSRNTANTKIAGVASVIWQTSFAKAGLKIDQHSSPALAALNKALGEKGVLGLTMRFNSYRTIYFDDPSLRNGSASSAAASQALIAKLNGGFQPNPARSVLVGVIGLWRQGEPAQEPGDRALLSVPPGEIVATAHARVTSKGITLDLANSITEVDELLNKQNLGPLTAVAVDGAGKVLATLGTLQYHQYDKNAYEAASGIVSLPLDAKTAAIAAKADIQIRAGDGTPYLVEQRLRAVPMEHNIYATGGDSVALPVQVLNHGAPAGAGASVALYDTNGAAVGTAITDASSTVTFKVATVPTGSVDPYTLAAGDKDHPPVAPAQLDTQLTPYVYVRSIPADTETAALDPTWDNVYTHVLANWNAMAPCMDNWLRLDDPVQVHAYGKMLKQLTDPANFELFRFMPVTRDMTPGERTLLWNFLDAPIAPPATKAMLGAEAPKPMRDLAKLSRAMRAG